MRAAVRAAEAQSESQTAVGDLRGRTRCGFFAPPQREAAEIWPGWCRGSQVRARSSRQLRFDLSELFLRSGPSGSVFLQTCRTCAPLQGACGRCCVRANWTEKVQSGLLNWIFDDALGLSEQFWHSVDQPAPGVDRDAD